MSKVFSYQQAASDVQEIAELLAGAPEAEIRAAEDQVLRAAGWTREEYEAERARRARGRSAA